MFTIYIHSDQRSWTESNCCVDTSVTSD